MEPVHIDYVGMEVTVAAKEKLVVKNVLIVVDHFTRYVQAFVTKNHTAYTTAWGYALLAFIALSAAQSSAQTHIHNAIVVVDTSNNAWQSQVHWLVGTPYLAIKASNVGWREKSRALHYTSPCETLINGLKLIQTRYISFAETVWVLTKMGTVIQGNREQSHLVMSWPSNFLNVDAEAQSLWTWGYFRRRLPHCSFLWLFLDPPSTPREGSKIENANASKNIFFRRIFFYSAQKHFNLPNLVSLSCFHYNISVLSNSKLQGTDTIVSRIQNCK